MFARAQQRLIDQRNKNNAMICHGGGISWWESHYHGYEKKCECGIFICTYCYYQKSHKHYPSDVKGKFWIKKEVTHDTVYSSYDFGRIEIILFDIIRDPGEIIISYIEDSWFYSNYLQGKERILKFLRLYVPKNRKARLRRKKRRLRRCA